MKLIHSPNMKDISVNPTRFALHYRLSYCLPTLMLMIPFLCFMTDTVYAGTTKTSLSKAVSSKLVTISGKANANGFNKKGLTLHIENTGKSVLEITIDPALIFIPEDTSYQDLIISGNVKATIAPGKSSNIELQSYCGKSSSMAPVSDLSFSMGTQADSNMIKVLDYIRSNNIGSEVAQSAVWVLTNKHELSTVYDENEDEASRMLVAYMAGLLGEKLPEFYKQYNINTTPGQPVFTKKTLKIFASFQWQLDSPQSLTLAVYNGKGREVEKMFAQRAFKPGVYELIARFQSSKVEAGHYYIRLLSGTKILKEKKVTVD